MKRTALVCAIAAASFGISALAQAQDFDRRGPDRGGRAEQHQRFDRHDDRRVDRHGDQRFDRGRFARDDHRGGRYADHRHFRRGEQLPSYYRGPQYVVQDWHARHWAPPPAGYRYVRAGNDVVLAAIATGLIASIILSN